MIKTNSFIPGRVYSIIYNSVVEMVGTRALEFGRIQELARLGIELVTTNGGNSINPLEGAMIEVRRVSTVQAAGNESWENYKRKNGIVTDTTRKPFYVVSPENDCIVVGDTDNTKGKTYLRGFPRKVTSETYMVNGIVAAPNQVEVIRTFKKNQSSSPLTFVTLPLDKLVNVTMDNE